MEKACNSKDKDKKQMKTVYSEEKETMKIDEENLDRKKTLNF